MKQERQGIENIPLDEVPVVKSTPEIEREAERDVEILENLYALVKKGLYTKEDSNGIITIKNQKGKIVYFRDNNLLSDAREAMELFDPGSADLRE